MRNVDEWLADTNPSDAQSLFTIVDSTYESVSGNISLTFLSSAIREYVLTFTEDLSQPFMAVQTVIGTGAEITLGHASGGQSGFYQVEVRIPSF